MVSVQLRIFKETYLQGTFELPTILSDSSATMYFKLESSIVGTLGYTSDLQGFKSASIH